MTDDIIERKRAKALIAKRRSETDYVRVCERIAELEAENAAGGAMTESIIDALTAKAWGEDGPHRKRAVHLEVAVAAVCEAGAECDDLAQLLGEAIEREKALEAENARLREAGNALAASLGDASEVIGGAWWKDHEDAVAAWQRVAGEAEDGSEA